MLRKSRLKNETTHLLFLFVVKKQVVFRLKKNTKPNSELFI